MKKQICLFFALLMAMLMLAGCALNGGRDTGGATDDTNGGEVEVPDAPTDSDTNADKPTDTDTGVGGEPSEPSDPSEPSEPEKPSEPSGVEITVSKTAAQLAESIGKGNNGDIVSGSEIKLDNNISVEFGKGTANTEPALYSEAIRIYQNGGTLTVSAKNGREIKAIIITASDGKTGSGRLVASDGSKISVSGNVITITPSNTQYVTVTVSGSNKSDRLYVESIEVVYMGQSGDGTIPNEPSEPENPDIGGGDEKQYLYNDFTAEEKSTYEKYVGLVIPFLPNNDYYIESYDEEGYQGVYLSALCESEEDFGWYLAKFSSYTNDGTDVDEYGDTWYLFSQGDVYIDVCYYQYEGAYYVDVDTYRESSGDVGGDTTEPEDPDTGDGEGEYQYYEFTSQEKSTYNDYVGLVIPFFPNNYYEIEAYDEGGYRGVYYSALCESETAFSWYLAMFSSYSNDGTDVDEYGDTWYLFSKGNVYIDVCYYQYDGAYYVDVDAYYEVSGDVGGDVGGDSGGNDNVGGEGDKDVITNAGAGLPNDDGDGIYDVDFTDADKVKDVTDQGYFLDGCPTLGSSGVLVIPVEFSDRTASSLGYDIDNIKSAFEKDGENIYYSVYDYYYISSSGQLTLDITVVDEWFRPSKPSTYYASYTDNYDGTETPMGDQLVIDEALAYLAEIMDLSKFDSDSNGTIDAVVLVTTLEIDPDTDFYWAYRYWNIYADENDNYYEYDGVSANDYLWAPYEFIHENPENSEDYSDKSIINPYTFIHEFGHILGAEDYYDTAYAGSSPLDGNDIMDAKIGDHNAYTKFNLGWITNSRLVVTDTEITVTLEKFSKNGDTLIIANNFDPSLGAYQEYYIIVYYTEDELNSGVGGYFDGEGIIVYHVNASLFCEEYGGEMYYDVYNTNTDPSDSYGTENNLIELVENIFGYLFLEGDTLGTLTDDLGAPLGYTFTVESLGEQATITVSAK